jgi:hypothetical protein
VLALIIEPTLLKDSFCDAAGRPEYPCGKYKVESINGCVAGVHEECVDLDGAEIWMERRWIASVGAGCIRERWSAMKVAKVGDRRHIMRRIRC